MPAPREVYSTTVLLGTVEKLVELPFFSDGAQERAAHTDPTGLSPELRDARIPSYIAGLRIIAKSNRIVLGQSNPEQLARVRYEYAGDIGDIRGELMTLDPGLETEEVRSLRDALAASQDKTSHSEGRRRRRNRKEPDALPPHLITMQGIDLFMGEGRSNVSLLQARHKTEPEARLKLPGSGPEECCFSWRDMQKLLHEPRSKSNQSRLYIDFDRLPSGPEDTDPDKIAYAREIQMALLPHHKLINIPELGLNALRNTVRIARPYHIARTELGKIMRRKFIDDYCRPRNMIRYMRRSNGQGFGEYLTVENAAKAWQEYRKIPFATETDVPIIDVAQRAEIVNAGYAKRTAIEQFGEAGVRRLRHAQTGRVMDHIDAESAAALESYLGHKILPPHLLPYKAFDQYVDISSSSAVRLRLSKSRFEPTLVRLHGSNVRTNCFGWDALEYIKDRVGKIRPGAPDIDFTRLPKDENDTDPDKIAYARTIQRYFVEPEVIGEKSRRFAKNTGILYRTGLLSAEEEVILAKYIEAGLMAGHKLKETSLSAWLRKDLETVAAEGNAAKKRMVEANTGLAKSIVKERKYQNKGLSYDELTQEGILGVIRAVEKFDYTKGIKFSTYAMTWIKQFITRAIYNTGNTLRIPVYISEKLDQVERLQRQGMSTTEIAKETGLTPMQLAGLNHYREQVLSLDAPLRHSNDRGTRTLADLIPDRATEFTGQVEDDIARKELRDLLKRLEPNRRQAIILRFNLDGKSEQDVRTYEQMGKIIGVSKQTAVERTNAALRDLRELYGINLEDIL